MKIIIPSYRRANPKMCRTIANWPAGFKAYVAVRQEEKTAYQQMIESLNLQGTLEVLPLPPSVNDICSTRLAIHNMCGNGFYCTMDDDLTIAKRNDAGKLVKANQQDFINMFSDLEKLLKQGYAQAGISQRNGNAFHENEIKTDTRCIQISALNGPLLDKHNIAYRIPFMEDFDLTLQILTKGLSNAVLYKYACDQAGSNTPGGCSEMRTLERHEKAAYALQRLHPEYVTLKRKTTKHSWNGQTRTDVTIQWKKASKEKTDD